MQYDIYIQVFVFKKMNSRGFGAQFDGAVRMHMAIFKIYPVPGYAPAVLDVLESMKTSLASSSECLDCSVAFETGEEGAIVYTERWHSLEALTSHLRSHIFLRVLEAMEFSRSTPKVMFFDVSEIGGMDVSEGARAG
jgi:quinol monooxygenase YgiN